jgi:hypothetical protein
LLEQTYASLLSTTFTTIVFVDFLQAFNLLWQEGLLLKLQRLNCPFSYLIWIKHYFTDRSMMIHFNGQLSKEITLKRGAPQGSIFGAIAFIVAHHDLHMLFQAPKNNHLYVDDLGNIFIPKTELRINNDLVKLHNYATEWHKPLKCKKTDFVINSRLITCPKLKILYNVNQIEQKRNFQYLAYRSDSKLSLNCIVDDHLQKCRGTYSILKYVHRRFPSFFQAQATLV